MVYQSRIPKEQLMDQILPTCTGGEEFLGDCLEENGMSFACVVFRWGEEDPHWLKDGWDLEQFSLMDMMVDIWLSQILDTVG